MYIGYQSFNISAKVNFISAPHLQSIRLRPGLGPSNTQFSFYLGRRWGFLGIRYPSPSIASPLRRVHPLTVHTLLLYSPAGLDLKLAKRALKDSLK